MGGIDDFAVGIGERHMDPAPKGNLFARPGNVPLELKEEVFKISQRFLKGS